MKRWPFHPVLRFVLAYVLVGWVLVVSCDVDPWDRGWLTSQLGRIIGQNTYYRVYRQTISPGPESIEFVLTKFGTTSARHEFVDSKNSLPVLDSGIPIASVYSPAPRYLDFGLIYPAISYDSKKTITIWHIPKEEWGYTDQMLEDAYSAYRDSVIQSNTPNLLRFSSNPFMAAMALQNRTTLFDSSSMLAFAPLQLLGELTYYFVFIWWLLTLRHARRLWPKPDDSLCPNCGYPTAGLTTPTCPECGNTITQPTVS